MTNLRPRRLEKMKRASLYETPSESLFHGCGNLGADMKPDISIIDANAIQQWTYKLLLWEPEFGDSMARFNKSATSHWRLVN